MNLVEVILINFDKPLTYKAAGDIAGRLERGCGVIVPLGHRSVLGIVTGFPDSTQLPESRIRGVISLMDGGPLLGEPMLRLADWIISYYCYPRHKVFEVMLPPLLQNKGYRKISIISHETAGQADTVAGLSPKLTEFYNFLLENGGTVDYKKIKAAMGPSAGSALSRLKAAGIVEESFILPRVNIKMEKVIVPVDSPHAGEGGTVKITGKVQQELLRYLKENGATEARLLNKMFNPGAVKRLVATGMATVAMKEVRRMPYDGFSIPSVQKVEQLTPAQVKVITEGRKRLEAATYGTLLLHGVTGSGKTEVYLRLAAMAVEKGRSVIILLPEISLTMHMALRFRQRFGQLVFVLHSGLTAGERMDEWRMIRDAKISVVIGARSAIFSPANNLGLVVVDEEHDSSYKQESGLRYNGRDLAVVRGQLSGALVMLGSATPSLESYYNATTGRYGLVQMPERVDSRPMPEIEVVDMKQYRAKKRVILSPVLIEEMQKKIDLGEQVLLFVNRRGFSTSLLCKECGRFFECANCSISMTYHKAKRKLECHCCGFSSRVTGICRHCGSVNLEEIGFGSERVEEIVAELFPDLKQCRMDRDTTKTKFAHLDILKKMESGDSGLLVGTQMVTKGHHLPGVTLVGVVLADLSLSFPDFRSAERTLQLLVQVAGRAGRGDKPGKIIIQAFNPEHYSIIHAKTHDYEGFYHEELEFRRALEYPPFNRLAMVEVIGENEAEVGAAAAVVAQQLRGRLNSSLSLLGPVPAALKRAKRMYKWKMLIKSKDVTSARQLLGNLVSPSKKVRVAVDFDPVNSV